MIKLFIFFTILISSSAFAKSQGGWVHITKKKGIDIFSKKSANSPIKSLRAEGLVDARIEAIVGILRDVPGSTSWVPNLVSRAYVENLSDTEAILHDVSDMPWPVKDRDLVVHHRLSISEDKKFLILNFKSVKNDKKKDEPDYVRAKIHFGTIEFHPRENKTFVRLTMLVDPMGKIPKWVVNLLQVKMPYEFIIAIDAYASKSTIRPLPGIQELIDQLELN